MYILTQKLYLSARFSEIARKGTTFYPYGKINCTKSADLCTDWLICAISLRIN